MNSYPIAQTVNEYESSITYGQSNPNEPFKRARDWKPSSSIEYVLGLRYGIGAAAKTAAESTGRKGLYLSVLGGYSLPLGAGASQNINFQSYTSKAISYGSGMNFGLMAGYSLANGLAFEIGGMYSQSTN